MLPYRPCQRSREFAQSAKVPDRRGKAREVEDLTLECKKWKRYGACDLDRDFNISSFDTTQSPVPSHEMFDFMLQGLSGACGWAGLGLTKHPRCQDWAPRLEECVFRMASHGPPVGRAAASLRLLVSNKFGGANCWQQVLHRLQER